MCMVHPYFFLSTKQKIEFCFSLTNQNIRNEKREGKNLTPTRHQKNVETSIHKKESQVVNRVFRNESVVFQQESLQSKLDKTQLKKISSLFATKEKIKCWRHNSTLCHTKKGA